MILGKGTVTFVLDPDTFKLPISVSGLCYFVIFDVFDANLNLFLDKSAKEVTRTCVKETTRNKIMIDLQFTMVNKIGMVTNYIPR